ncbi:MAG: cobyric acid synthase [Alphaproteobacteria bacterium]|nr:cobyric acid synthase [Alphaproteobacteria bacterium]
MTAALMLQGTGSNVGKSLITTGLCRAYVKRGLTVRPFKPQNMSNNAAVTVEGGEIGRAQALQAIACGVEPSVDMNPILLKPETETGAQVVVRGVRAETLKARAYMAKRATYLPAILESFAALGESADLVLVEGAGSPAEINLRNDDIANMGFAHAAGISVVLIGDIHRGGVMASIAGTLDIIPAEDTAQIKAFLINNFHGDVSLFDEGKRWLEDNCKIPCAGIIPHFASAQRLPDEDAVALEDARLTGGGAGKVKIAVPRLSRIANFDDLDPLKLEEDVHLEIVPPGTALPGDADLVLIPGSKATVSDLQDFRAQGWDIDLAAHIRRGGKVLGLCAGYQMLGRKLHDPEGIEGPAGSADGLGHLDVETVLTPEKSLERVDAVHLATGEAVVGYEMHIGRTEGPDCAHAFASINGTPDGAAALNGQIQGTYLHGLFASDAFRAAYLEALGGSGGGANYLGSIETTLDELADHLERSVDLDLLLNIASTAK